MHDLFVPLIYKNTIIMDKMEVSYHFSVESI